jgi:tripeptide aminopeptidase
MKENIVKVLRQKSTIKRTAICIAAGLLIGQLSFSVSAQPIDKEKLFAIPEWAKPVAPWPTVPSNVTQAVDKILASPDVKKAMDFLKQDDPRALKETILLSEISAPALAEEKKAKAYVELMKKSGLTDIKIDKVGNVIAVRKGTGGGPTVVVDAHLDTVFPVGTDIKVKVKDGIYFGPGLTDDTRGLGVMLSMVRALNEAKIETVGDLVFLASVGEEGLGNLKGIKNFFAENKNIDAALIIEALPLGAAGIISTASNRYQVNYTAPGGHSYAAFGMEPSAIHAMGRAISKISDLQVPKVPRTTFTVGIVKGGRSVNTISPDATMEIDVRSDGTKELAQATKQILDIVDQSVVDENKRWGTSSLKVNVKVIGERAGGTQPADSLIVQSYVAALRGNNQKELMLIGASTNAGVPVSLGVPTLIIGPGGRFTGFHALTEGMDPTDAYKGAQVDLTMALSLVGVKGVAEPLIAKKVAK